MSRKDAGCPLCGAQVTAMEWLDASTEVVDAHVQVLAAVCPHCQGRLQVQLQDEGIALGYLAGGESNRFESALNLPCAGLQVEQEEDGLRVSLADRVWQFTE